MTDILDILDILVDIDGTTADFTTAVLRLYGWDDVKIQHLYHNWPSGVYWLHNILGVSKSQCFRTIDAGGPAFWQNLQKFPWTDQLLHDLGRIGQVTFCTSPGLSPDAAAGKVTWIKACGLGHNFVLTSQKHLCANPNAVLLDDHDEMVANFKSRGGHAFLIPQPWNGRPLCKQADIDAIVENVKRLADGAGKPAREQTLDERIAQVVAADRLRMAEVSVNRVSTERAQTLKF